MPSLEYIQYSPEMPELNADSLIHWFSDRHKKSIKRLPQIFWSNGESWSEANIWALDLARSKSTIKTVISNMQGLLTYAKWLEAEGVQWWYFPQRAYERCLHRYRGYLVDARDRGGLAPSTVSNRMAVAIRFYRWVHSRALLQPENPMWNEQTVRIMISDVAGFERSIVVATTDLAIPNRKPTGVFQLEGGLMPVTIAQRDEILSFVGKYSSEEFSLMLRLGFGTGMRLGSICDLKEETIINAVPAPTPGFKQLSIGPQVYPPVSTKMGVSGRVLIPNSILEELKKYLWSNRRHLRKRKARSGESSLVFLTKSGKPYEDERGGHTSVNTEMARLRKLAEKEGVSALRDFRFHRSRATFATMLMMIALETFPDVSTAIKFVRDACLHRNESTTLEYVKFIEDTKAMNEAAGKFAKFFMGVA